MTREEVYSTRSGYQTPFGGADADHHHLCCFQDPAASSVSTSPVSTSSMPTSVPTSPTNDSGGFSKGDMIGTGLGAACGAILVAGLGWLLLKRQRKKRQRSRQRPIATFDGLGHDSWEPQNSLMQNNGLNMSELHGLPSPGPAVQEMRGSRGPVELGNYKPAELGDNHGV